MPAHVKKGDTVIVLSGSHKGKIGEIKDVDPKDQMVTVQGVNMKTKHVKPSRLNAQGGIITKEGPLHWSKVAPVVDGKSTRVRFEVKPDGSKVRLAVRGGKVLSTVRGPKAKTGAKGGANVGVVSAAKSPAKVKSK